MKKQDIEYWTLQAIDRAQTKQQTEDAYVEFKREWIKPDAAARRIAGHANAARGEPILWIIGVDDSTGNILGANRNDLANWWPSVESQFDGITPTMLDLVVPVGSTTVVVLYFETDRGPYVVKNSSGGAIGTEVPWREGTRTRSAKREELVKILMPLSRNPQLEILYCEIQVDTGIYKIELDMQVYITPLTDRKIAIPKHKVEILIQCASLQEPISLEIRKMRPPSRDIILGTSNFYETKSLIPTIQGDNSQVVIDGPGVFELYAIKEGTNFYDNLAKNTEELTISFKAFLASSDVPFIQNIKLTPSNSENPASFKGVFGKRLKF